MDLFFPINNLNFQFSWENLFIFILIFLKEKDIGFVNFHVKVIKSLEMSETNLKEC